ncbi:hypothetical protein [Lacinutrix himadriensis]|uniref:hypothetical protein n=1 Tax=Lacinutrix himadriensis TaxID=641549 RepID=UPI0006E2AFE7|nr:hypothetical protein [Lacinutrix himadriensis]
MNIQKTILIVFFTFFIYSCKEKTEYLNESDTCELNLYDDLTYKFKYPTFFGTEMEKGNYEIRNNKITLSRKSYKKIDSVDIGYSYSWDGTDKPDSLYLNFKNLNKEVIKAEITFNNSLKKFESNNPGEIILSYNELENLGIISSNEVINDYTIYFNNNIYSPDMSSYLDSRRPKRIDFKLNQFVDKDYAILKRVYQLENDTIFINDISRKSIGKQNKLVKKINTAANKELR